MPLIGSGLLSAGGAPAFVGAYDGISNLAAVYSVRRVLASYTGPLLRLRRDSDNAESDFGYVAATGDLDTASIATWLGGATPYVTTWYDQQGSVNYTQSTQANQPALVTESGSGKPGIQFFAGTTTGDFLRPGNFDQSISGYVHLFFLYRYQTGSPNGLWGDRYDNGYVRFTISAGEAGTYTADNKSFTYADGVARVNGAATTSFDGLHISDFKRGSSVPNISNGTLGRGTVTTTYSTAAGIIQEFVVGGPSAISTADHNTIGGSMASYYGLTWNTIA